MNNEALRCLLCKKPKCALQGCPVHTPVPECMLLYREGKLDQAGELLFENNPLTAVTSQVCDWKQFCYGHCVLNVKQVPVRWYGRLGGIIPEPEEVVEEIKKMTR